MSSVSSPKGQNPFWQYTAPPVAAGIAIILPYRYWMLKSAIQLEKPMQISWVAGIKEGVKSAPLISGIVGSQLVMEKWLSKDVENPNFVTKIKNSAMVGFASSVPLAIFNGRTMGLCMKESIKALSFSQCVVIAARETAFVGGIALADPISAAFTKMAGEHVVVRATAAFFSGVCGSLGGHPFDVIVTRAQKQKATKVNQYALGALTRAKGASQFALVYHMSKEMLNYMHE